MKKLFFNFNRLLLLGLAVMMASSVWGQTTTKSFTITFNDNGSDGSTALTSSTFLNQVTGNKDSIKSVSTSYCYPGTGGIKVSSNNNNGSFTLTLKNSKSITKVVLSVKNKNATTKAVTVGSTNFTTSDSYSTSAFADMEFTGTETNSDQIYVSLGGTANKKRVAYIASMTIYYKEASASTPELTTSATSLAFGNVESGSNKSLNTLTISGANLTNDITYAISGTNADFFSVTSPSSPISKGSGTVSATTITVKYAPTATGSHTAKLTFSSTGATAKEVTLTGTGTAPACTTSPTVSAGAISNPGLNSLTFNCASGISSLGSAGCTITEYGYVYGTSANPTTSNTKHSMGTTYTTTGTSFGAYTPDNLSCGTTYYMRPYATNGNGTAYGTQASASTSACPVDVFIDNMHSTGDFASPGKSFSSAYTKAAITISDKAQAAPTAECQTAHYHFIGWVTAATRESKKSQYADSDIVVFQTSDNAPTGTTYYAVWAKEAQ